MDKKIVHTKADQNSPFNFNDTSAQNQRNIVFIALRESPKTTIDLRDNYGVMMPAARVKELREQGYKIITVRLTCYTADGIKHSKVAKYVLVSEKANEVAV